MTTPGPTYYLTPDEAESIRIKRPKEPPYGAYARLLREVLKSAPVSLYALRRTLRGHWHTLAERDLYARSKAAIGILEKDGEQLRVPGKRIHEVLAHLDRQRAEDESMHF